MAPSKLMERLKPPHFIVNNKPGDGKQHRDKCRQEATNKVLSIRKDVTYG